MTETQHQLKFTESNDLTCTVCGRVWEYRPSYPCPGVPQYEWGNVPDHLATEAQLRERGLKTEAAPVGCLWWANQERYIWLYDVSQAAARPPATAAQLAALEKARLALTCQVCGRRVSRKRHLQGGYCDNCRFILWARERLADPDVRIVDTETTGLDGHAEIVEIAILDSAGQALLDTLVRPTVPIPADASRIHGIHDTDVACAPAWPVIWPQVVQALRGKVVIAYNADFDRRMIHQTRKAWKVEELLDATRWECLMDRFMFYIDSRRWVSLSAACEMMRVPAGGHRALDDARAAWRLLTAMAGQVRP